jgi:hypothetical protein
MDIQFCFAQILSLELPNIQNYTVIEIWLSLYNLTNAQMWNDYISWDKVCYF